MPENTESNGVELPEVGTVLGDYRLEAVIAEGGMGRVYDAVHTKLGRPVALKMLLPSQAADENVRKRFFGEARAVNRIQHENLVNVTDFVDEDETYSYYIMERLAGRSLRDILEEEGPLEFHRCVRILLQLADVLASLHEDQIVHRDIKPENIYIVPQASNPDFVKLIDFGVAKILDKEGELLLPAEKRGSILGTPHYMAPEQADGKPVDDLADIYAFGVLMFELFTGRLPIDADDITELLALKKTVIPAPASSIEGLPQPVPPELDALISECLATKPGDRPQSMQEVRLRLMVLEGVEKMPAELLARMIPLPVEGSLWQRRKRRQWLIRGGIGAAVVAVLAILGLGLSQLAGQSQESAQPAFVALRFVSEPAGATVSQDDRELGKTPFALSLPKRQDTSEFVFALHGYEPEVRVVILLEDQEIRVLLTPMIATPSDKPKRKPKRKKRRKSKFRPGGFIDPYAK